MKFQVFIFSIILPLLFIPIVNAQISDEDSKQKSIQVSINSLGEVNVIHEIGKLNTPYQFDLVKGTISNLSVTDKEGNEIQYGEMGNIGKIMLLPYRDDIIVQYDLSDELVLVDNIWTWNFLYLESTSFIFPDEVEWISVNDRSVYLTEKKGIMCHGCQMILEYSINEPKSLEKIEISDNEYLIEIKTWAEINQFNFDQKIDGFSFQVSGENDFVTTVIPLNFLAEPYQVLLDEEKIFFQEYFNNGTHVWLSMRPQSSGDVSITGTLIPDIPSDSFLGGMFPVEYYLVIIVIVIVIISVIFLKRKKG